MNGVQVLTVRLKSAPQVQPDEKGAAEIPANPLILMVGSGDSATSVGTSLFLPA